ncbi:MAG: methyltransferase domain-containing protein, partial [Candidatus Tectomicrobia bacterium]|nr:methyltransferase domain-containing protein [Candidatus Tectomicrobia bacterium]
MFTKMDETNVDKWKKHFDDLANKFGQSIKANDYFDVRHFRAMQEIVSRIIKETQANLIVDVGCGNGVFSEMAATERTVYGIDISSAMLKYAVQKGLKCIQSNALELPLRSDSSDITLFIGV